MIRSIGTYVIYLKHDLKIADACKSTREQLLEYITNKEFFSEELVTHFVRTAPNIPFAISTTDPSQVSLLKKLINCLEHSEKALRAVENLNVRQDRYKAGIIYDAAKISYNAIHEIYAAIQLINHSSADIHNIVGPHLSALMPKIALASKALGQFTPEHPEESAGALLADVMKKLPTEKHSEAQSLENLSSMIFEIPHYLEELQKIVSTGASGLATKSITSAKEYQAIMLKKANDTNAHFNKLLTTNSEFSSFNSCLGILKQLVGLSSHLLNQAAPLSKQAYLDAADKLQEIKHTHLPQMISELEKMEESMGLKPGLLTMPAIKKMDEYYTQLATQVDNIAQGAGVLDTASDYMSSPLGKVIRRIFFGDKTKMDVGEKLKPVPDLLVMQDIEFSEKRREYQTARLSETILEANDTQTKEAATRFFNVLYNYSSWYQITCKWSLVNISQDEKYKFLKDYKQFQSHFAALNPDIDKLIVDALTKPTEESIVSRLYSSDYKQLWGSNQFTKVLSCKDALLESIDQSVAQARFKEELIKKSMSHSEQMAYEALDKKTSLKAEVTPFSPVEYVFEDNKPSSAYHKKVIAISHQITQIERAQKGVNGFLSLVEPASPTTDIASLDEISKENLRKFYQQFQPQLIAMGYDDINERLVQSLSSSKSTKPPLCVADLKKIREEIHTKLGTFLSHAKYDKKAYLDQEKVAKLTELERAPLVAKGSELERRTLFGMLQDMQLSKSVDEFFTGKFQNYLKENLSPVVWEQLSKDGKLDLSNIPYPYTEFHKDSPEVKMYKELINSVYHIKSGLAKLETINDYGDPKSIVNRSRFVASTMCALIFDICNSQYYLKNALNQMSGIPAFNAMIHETLELLSPIQRLPLIGDYLTPHEQLVPLVPLVPLDYVELWKEQQAIVQGFLSPSTPKPESVLEPEPEAPEVPPIVPPEKGSMVRLIAEALYKIPSVLETVSDKLVPSAEKDAQTEANIKAFVQGLDGLSFGPDSVKKIISTLSKVEMQLSDIGASGREAVLARLQGIRSELGFVLMAATDETELNLGLKPGTYSSTVSQRFDLFYDSLINNTPLEKAQQALELMIDVTHTQKRLHREEERLLAAQEDNTAVDTKRVIFGDDFENTNKVFNAYKKLNDLITNSRYYDYDRANTEGFIRFRGLQREVDAVYQEIQPLLAEAHAGIFDENFISRCDDVNELNAAMNRVVAAREAIYNPSTALTKIQQLYLDSDFSQTKDQEQFIREYQKFQPHLSKITYEYDNYYFLRELQGPKDFVNAAAKISGEVGRLEEVIRGLEKNKVSKISLAEERVAFVNNLLTEQIQKQAPQKIVAFKEKVFTNYVKVNIASALAKSMGPHAALFIEHSMTDFLGKKDEILHDLSLIDDIEASVAKRVDEIVPAIITKNTDSFKQLLFSLNVNDVVKESFKEELGIYTEVFFKKIEPIYEAEKERILSDIPLDKNLGSAVLSQLSSITPQAVQENIDLKTACAKLNTFVKGLNQLIAAERDNPNQSPHRKKKIELLTELQKRVCDTSFIPAERTVEYLHQPYLSAQTELEAIKENDASMQIDDVLQSLGKMIYSESKQPVGNQCRYEKIEKLKEMQGFLEKPYSSTREDDKAKFLSQRQHQVKNFLTSLREYDEMIVIYDHLEKMKTYVTSTQLSPEVRTEQTQLLKSLQGKLVNRDKSPSVRLWDLKTEGEDGNNQKILNKNSDSLWTFLCKSFNNFLVKIGFKAPSTNVDGAKVLISDFRAKLNNIKEGSPPTPKPAHDSPEKDLDPEVEVSTVTSSKNN